MLSWFWISTLCPPYQNMMAILPLQSCQLCVGVCVGNGQQRKTVSYPTWSLHQWKHDPEDGNYNWPPGRLLACLSPQASHCTWVHHGPGHALKLTPQRPRRNLQASQGSSLIRWRPSLACVGPNSSPTTGCLGGRWPRERDPFTIQSQSYIPRALVWPRATSIQMSGAEEVWPESSYRSSFSPKWWGVCVPVIKTLCQTLGSITWFNFLSWQSDTFLYIDSFIWPFTQANITIYNQIYTHNHWYTLYLNS